MYGGTVSTEDLQLAELRKIVPDVTLDELTIAGDPVVGFPAQRPWLTPYGVGLINITSIRRSGPGDRLEFQLADEHGKPYDDGEAWATKDKFWQEWPQ